MGRTKHYSLQEKAEVLALLDAEDGNKSAVSRQTGVSRRTIRSWEDDKKQILSDYKQTKQVQEASTDLTWDEAEGKIENAKIGENYDIVKKSMADSFAKLTNKAQKIAFAKLGTVNAKDAMWIASIGIDKLMKLKGEPDQIVEVRNVVVHMVIDKLLEAVNEGVIEKGQAEILAEKFDEIEEAEYEEV